MTRAEKDKRTIDMIRRIMWIPDHFAYVIYGFATFLTPFLGGKITGLTETEKLNNFECTRSLSYMFVIGLITALFVMLIIRVIM